MRWRLVIPLASSMAALVLISLLLVTVQARPPTPDPPTRDNAAPNSDRGKAIAAVRAFVDDPQLDVTYTRTTKTPYNLDKSVEVYFAGTGEFTLDPSTNTVIQFGPRPGINGEPDKTVASAPRLTSAQLEQRARALIVKLEPAIDMSSLVLRFNEKTPPPPPPGGGKGGNDGATAPVLLSPSQSLALFFRWEAPPVASTGPTSKPAFIQVGLSPAGELVSYTNTLGFSQ